MRPYWSSSKPRQPISCCFILAPTKSTYNLIKELLVHIINESGGLKPEDEGDDTAQDEEMIKDEEDIEIPKSEFTDELGENLKLE